MLIVNEIVVKYLVQTEVYNATAVFGEVLL